MFCEIEEFERNFRFLDSLDNAEFDSNLSDVDNEENNDRSFRMKRLFVRYSN